MTSLAIIRTNNWDSACDRLYRRLRYVFKRSLVACYHNRAEGVELPIPVVDMPNGWPQSQGLYEPDDWGWRCGDYALYAAQAAYPNYDYYWLIEPDVHFTSHPAEFFGAFENATEDLLGYEAEAFGHEMRFLRNLDNMQPYRATFAVTRVSAKALTYLRNKRIEDSAKGITARFWPNDEFFCWTHIAAKPDQFSFGKLATYAPSWLEGTEIIPGPDRLLDHVKETVPTGRVLHPVRDRKSYLKTVARRAVGSAGFLERNRSLLGYFKPEEIEEHVQEVARLYRASLLGDVSSRAARQEQVLRRQRAMERKRIDEGRL